MAERWESADGYAPDRVPTGSAHDLVPPLFVSVAQAWISAGRPERALALLDRRRNEAVRTRQDDSTVRQAEAATVAVISRLGLTDRQAFLRRLESTFTWAADLETRHQAMRALAIIGFPVLTSLDPHLNAAATWHAWWQSQPSSALAKLVSFDPHVADWPPPQTSADAADIRADLEELRRLFSDRETAPSAHSLSGMTRSPPGSRSRPRRRRPARPNRTARCAPSCG